MVEQGPNAEMGRVATDEGEPEGIDLDQIREMAGFVLGAARRRKALAIATFIVVAAIGITISLTMPKKYSAQVKLLAQRNSAIRVLSSQTPQMNAVDDPTKNVWAMITRRENLVGLVKDAHLLERFEQTRPPALKLKDRVMAMVFGPPSNEDKELGLVYTLEKQLEVLTEGDTVTITVEWTNPRIAYDLVTLVQKNFLEARYDSDVAVINDSIAVLEDHAKSELAHVDATLEEYQKLVAERAVRPAQRVVAARGPIAGTPASRPAPSVGAATGVDPDLAQALEEKRRQIRAIEETQQHTLDGLRRQLMEAQLTLTPMHPTVVALQQQVDSLSQPSPELTQLRADERALMAQLAPPPVAATASAALPSLRANPATPASADPDPVPAPALPPIALDRDGTLQLAQSKLAAAIRSYQDALARIDAAGVELEITRTSYKHRYTIFTPAELPKAPKKATARLIGLGSVVGAGLLALLLATAADLAAGLVLESWQVKRRLKLEVLGEFDKPW